MIVGRDSLVIKKAPLTTRKIAQIIAEFADDKKAEDIEILDMKKIVNFCDYFVICSGTTDRHARAIADGIQEGLGKDGVNVDSIEGRRESHWIIFDLGDVVTHIFTKPTREFYRLEVLWQDAKHIKWQKKK